MTPQETRNAAPTVARQQQNIKSSTSLPDLISATAFGLCPALTTDEFTQFQLEQIQAYTTDAKHVRGTE